MLAAIRERRNRDDEGFTLIELMVVVLIIAILLAIAIPTFLGAQNRAKDRAAQSDLRNGLTAAKTLATDQEGFFRKAGATAGTYAALTNVDLYNAEKSLSFVTGSTNATVDAIGVSVESTTAPLYDEILVVKKSKASDGYWWGIWADKDGDVKYCKSDDAAQMTLANCSTGADSFADTVLL